MERTEKLVYLSRENVNVFIFLCCSKCVKGGKKKLPCGTWFPPGSHFEREGCLERGSARPEGATHRQTVLAGKARIGQQGWLTKGPVLPLQDSDMALGTGSFSAWP